MFVFKQKLKILKARFKVWNKQVFGDVNQKVESALDLVDQVQNQIALNGFSNDLQEQEFLAQQNLQKALAIEESLWKQKANLKWFCCGDRNIAYFHRSAKSSTKKMSILKNGDEVLEVSTDIEQHVL